MKTESYREASDLIGKPKPKKGKKLYGQDLKDFINERINDGYESPPHVPLAKRLEKHIVELYKTNGLKPEEIIHSLGILLGTAIKSSGVDYKAIQGENYTITIHVTKNEDGVK